MREIRYDLNSAKERIKKLKGIEVRIKVNRGRNRITEYVGHIDDVHTDIFTFFTPAEKLSFSYSDVLTKNVRIYPTENTKLN